MKAREAWLVAALALLPIAPFAGAAFGIDEPVFLEVARRITEAPLDPFGFEMVWDTSQVSAARFNLNPPLLSYWIAPWLALFGESETWLRIAAWPFALLAAFAFHGIARIAGVAPLPATALFVATPAFVVLAGMLQLDVAVTAWLLAAVCALLRARESGSARDELWAGVAAAAAGLTKYAGLAALPLLAAGLAMLPGARRPTLGSWLRVLGVPAFAFTVWGAWTYAQYGFVHYAAGLELVGGRQRDLAELPNQLASTPIWYGGALVFPVCIAAAQLWRDRRVGLALVGALAGAGVAFMLPDGLPARGAPLELEEAVLAALCFAAMLWCAALVLSRGKALLHDPLDRFLALWAGGFLFFTLFVNWHVSAADALLIAPPLLLLLLRDPRALSVRSQWIVAGVSLALALALAVADAAQRNVYRSVANALQYELSGKPGARWSVGQWGFQYYMSRAGFEPLVPATQDIPGSPLAKGDWISAARNVSQLKIRPYLDLFEATRVRSYRFDSAWPLRTTNSDAGAGFYTNRSGHVPFAWSQEPLDDILLATILSGPSR